MKLSVAPTDIHALARLTARYGSGLCTETHLTAQFHKVLNRLQALMVEWRPLLSGLRHRPSSAMRECDNAISTAQRLCKGREFRECLSQLKLARHELARLQELLDAWDDYHRATEAYWALTALLDSQQLCQMLTIETIRQLLVESDKLLASGRSRQAGFIARLCRNKALALMEAPHQESSKVQEFSVKLDRQAEFFRLTAAFAPSPANDLKLCRAFERLPNLLAERRIALVALLVADIECELASRRAVWVSLERQRSPHEKAGAVNQLVIDELKRIVREESWEQAASYLLRQVLAALSSEATALHPAIWQIKQKMETVDSSNVSQEDAIPRV
jgi:hypothetical protein